MDATPLYDLSPALRLALMGLALAAGPLAWVWMRHAGASPARRLRALTLLTLFLTFDLVVFGAFTRLTDSGLGCPDWPGCYGSASPTGAHAEISAAQAEMPAGPVTHSKAWIEMIHRYLATTVGVLITASAIGTWAQRRRGVPVHPAWAIATFVWVCVQGAFGALTVTMKLFPAIVTLHLLGGVLLLVLLRRQAADYAFALDGHAPARIGAGLRRLLWAGFALLWLQVALGGWVSTNYAVLACSDFPQCQASWWPVMDVRQGFEPWRELGLTSAGQPVDFAALTAIHYVHRLAAYVVLAVLAVLAWRLHREGLRGPARWLGALLLAQLLTGLSNIVLGWPLLAAVAHTGGAAALMVVMTGALCETRATAGASSSAFAEDEPMVEATA